MPDLDNLKLELRRDAFKPDGSWEDAKVGQLRLKYSVSWVDLAQSLAEIEAEDGE
jgi:hypothetical protein